MQIWLGVGWEENEGVHGGGGAVLAVKGQPLCTAGGKVPLPLPLPPKTKERRKKKQFYTDMTSYTKPCPTFYEHNSEVS